MQRATSLDVMWRVGQQISCQALETHLGLVEAEFALRDRA